MRLLQQKIDVFPDAVMVNFGMHKLVFHLRHKATDLALKVGKPKLWNVIIEFIGKCHLEP